MGSVPHGQRVVLRLSVTSERPGRGARRQSRVGKPSIDPHDRGGPLIAHEACIPPSWLSVHTLEKCREGAPEVSVGASRAMGGIRRGEITEGPGLRHSLPPENEAVPPPSHTNPGRGRGLLHPVSLRKRTRPPLRRSTRRLWGDVRK